MQTGGFAAELQKEVEKVKLSREWRREYMTLQIYVDDIRREEREAGRQEGIQKGIQKGIQDGEIRKLISQVMKKLSSGKDIERIAEETEESRDSLEPIIDVITSHPDYDLDEVFDCLNSRQ